MKTQYTFVVMLLMSLILSEVAFCSDNTRNNPKFSKNNIESLIMGLNSENKGVVIGCAILAGDYRVTEAVEPLAKILNSNLSFDVKTAAVYALYQIQTRDALATLKNACTNNNCQFLKLSAQVFLNHYLIINSNKNISLEENLAVTE